MEAPPFPLQRGTGVGGGVSMLETASVLREALLERTGLSLAPFGTIPRAQDLSHSPSGFYSSEGEY